ncbi:MULTISPECIES: DUF305 domain-containing protein [Adhaeribacter]|uniref:DUF305 domain-containing protein n=2 Tax=Adhaeribacter TaxID=299566 RepID=A0A512B5T2_9BACT|nr:MULTISPECIES: DUF305 domain-containing protein [Adhaeribacter]KAA5542040.1 DUF305 domain-containing protein [Adhaeribacter rhizoryzae]GEO07304.1 hypothetical protein AAE02nite_49680 [Adhaeribacter aerolatus]
MKTKKSNWNLAIWLCSATLFFSACNQNSGKTETATTEQTGDHAGHDMAAGSSNNKMMDLMHENMTAMQEMKMTGDVDHDFAQMMAIHHEGALTMAQEEVDNGQDSMLVNMAKQTLSAQKEEQEKLQKFVSSHQPAAADTAASMKLMQPMKTMMTSMDHNMKGTTDHHFASLMSMHHQSAIDMANAYLPNAKVPEIKAMAQKIIKDQEKEIQQLDTWLQAHPQQ